MRTFSTTGYVPGIISSKRLAHHPCLARLSLPPSTQLSLEARGGHINRTKVGGKMSVEFRVIEKSGECKRICSFL
eukprot:scaffold463_cov46-Attheya_sp.AAC.1